MPVVIAPMLLGYSPMVIAPMLLCYACGNGPKGQFYMFMCSNSSYILQCYVCRDNGPCDETNNLGTNTTCGSASKPGTCYITLMAGESAAFILYNLHSAQPDEKCLHIKGTVA